VARREPGRAKHRLNRAVTAPSQRRHASLLWVFLNNSLMPTLARVFSSTVLTMTAQYKLCELSAAGMDPDTTTAPGGMRP